MSHFLLFCAEVMGGRFFGVDLDRDSLDDLQAGALQSGQFFGVIRDYAHLAKAEVKEYFGTLLIISCVNGKSKPGIGLDSIGALRPEEHKPVFY